MKSIQSSYWILIGLTFACLIAIGVLWPVPANWEYTFDIRDKGPFGLYIFRKEMPSIFRGQISEESIPAHKRDTSYIESHDPQGPNLSPMCVIFIHPENQWQDTMVNNILSHVNDGHSLFLSTTNIPNLLSAKLDICVTTKSHPTVNEGDTLTLILDGTPTVAKLTDNVGLSGSYISHSGYPGSEILGFVSGPGDTVSWPNFVKIPYGKGHVFLHTEPVVFTNFYLLNGTSFNYTETLLSVIPDTSYIFWSQYKHNSKVVSSGVLRYIMSQPPLKWGWILLLSGLFLFVLTTMRRSQRIIPVLHPLENTTLSFVSAIGDLYMKKGYIRGLMDKKIVYLLERIRSRFFLSTDVMDDDFTEQLSLKSGQDIETVRQMIFLIQKHRKTNAICTMDDLLKLHLAIEKFNTPYRKNYDTGKQKL